MMIESGFNAGVREVARLMTDGRLRKKTGRFAVEGVRLLREVLDADVITIHAVYFTQTAAQKYRELWDAVSLRVRPGVVADRLAAEMADTETPQGVFAVCSGMAGARWDAIPRNGRAVLLENVRDPSNMGAVVRTAEAFGLDGLILTSGCADLTSPKVIRASMGGIFRLAVVRAAMSGADAVRRMRAAGMRCYACTLSDKAVPVTRVCWKQGVVAVIGNEGSGLIPDTAAACDSEIIIPMAGRAESLNAAMAAGIVMWEMSRE